MNRSSNSHSSMFLMEMMIAILFFSLVSAVCLRMFTKSHQMSEDARNLNMANNQIQNAAELLKHAYTPGNSGSDREEAVFPKILSDAYPDAAEDAQEIIICFDENWNPCATGSGAFFMKISQRSAYDTHDKGTSAAENDVYEILVLNTAGEEISSLELNLHQPIRP